MRVAVLAEQNFNLIDGSTIWLLNTCKLLALQPDFDTDLLLRHRLTTRLLADELPTGITLRDAEALCAAAGRPGPLAEGGLNIADLPGIVLAWEARHGAYDRIFVRGTELLTRLLDEPAFCDRIVGYAPNAIPDVTQPEPEWVQFGRQRRMPVVVQSETAKRALETLSDYPAHVVHAVPPVVFQEDAPEPRHDGPATLCYSGKIDLQYGLDWLLDLCADLETRPPTEGEVRLRLIAGKDTRRKAHPDFFAGMDRLRARVAQGDLAHVELHSNLPHVQAKALMAGADFAFCLRHNRYDDVIEISTKIVEFCAMGVPPILNDSEFNRSLFGADYPYLVDISQGDIVARIRGIVQQRGTPTHDLARDRALQIAGRFSAPALAAKLGRAIRGHGRPGVSLSPAPRHILIATHERKFLRQMTDRLLADPGIRLSWETWASSVKPSGQPHVPADVDTVLCEWCCENAVWHSHNKRPGTRLLVRLHRFEAFRDFPERVQWDNVDALIVVSEYFRDLMVTRFGVAPERVHVMPQYIDWHELQRPKLPEARFTLGLVGINPFEHKRFDRAIDFLVALRARDPRFQLAVRSAMPWEIEWVWSRQDDTRARFEAQFARIFADPDLAGAIRFDPAGPDMEEWYRGIGTILSSSDTEGCHTAVIEGMASGCLPVVHDWPGARSLFDGHVYERMEDAIAGVIAFATDADQPARRADLSRGVACYDLERCAERLLTL
ncbi:glycosyltransferase [Ruegeria pomeroyi]|uniref:Glycosyltransferase n=1 Tax=Ruegeria pomeroyi TaxID=89184 RepID=A0A9Q3WQD3_9RHOB|nr:glycosyltransferase [Ruegeria pomeroyi]MCE8540153.1 glycosyltransferase [Ruegeria pomeroyi]